MIRRSVLVFIFAIALLSCDSDFKQGSCDEGFFEQTDGNGGILCVPITDESTSEGQTADTFNEAN